MGIQLPVSLKYGYSVLRFIDDGSYEQGEAAIVVAKLSSEDIVLELGSGIGFISALCAQKTGSASVHTFEANPAMMPMIQRLYTRNNVQPHCTNALLSSASDQTFFFTDKNFLASTQKITKSKNKEVQVPVLALNDVIKELNPTYLIMDIEGNEYDIFTIIDFHTIRKVQFELHEWLLSKEQVAVIFSKLHMAGFEQDSISDTRNYYFYR